MALTFRPHDRIHARVDRVGAERSPVIVIDNFASDPQALVDLAASLAPFAPAARTYYPGVTAAAPMSFALGAHAYLDGLIRQTFELGDAQVAGGACDFSMVTKRPCDLHIRQQIPHIDSTEIGSLALLLYLCPGEHGGTGLYRHRRTGFEIITAERLDAYERALGAGLAAAAPPAGYIDGDSNLFERIADYEAVFNRMLIYRGANLHSGDIAGDFAFDPDPRAGRLTLNLFLLFRPILRGPPAAA